MKSQNLPVKKRLDWIDRTKGLAIIGICLFHFFQNYPQRLDIVSLLDRTGAKVGFAAVDIFFVIAGFNISYSLARFLQKNKTDRFDISQINWISWLKKRLIRLYPTYILAVIASVLILHWGGKLKIFPLWKFLLSAIGLAGYEFQRINPGFWFFTVILQAYLVTPIIFYICKNNRRHILLLGIVVGILSKIISAIFIKDPSTFFFLLQNNWLGSYFLPFCLGLYWGLVYAEHDQFRKVDKILSAVIFAIGFVIYLSLGILKIDIRYMLGFDMLFTAFFVQVCYWLFDTNIKWVKTLTIPIAASGIYSYQIYLLIFELFHKLLGQN